MDDTTSRVIQAITGVLKLDSAEVVILQELSGFKKLRKWTSARHAEVMVAVEDEFGIMIDELSIPRLTDVAKIVAYIHSTAKK
jgi:acyl carrier protein